ncbi:MAG: APC family permease [Dermatophilaceae bacterium]
MTQGTLAPPAEAPVRLERHLTLWPLVLFGLAYISPFIVLTTFGVFSETSHGTLALSYAVATVAMIFTAFSYGKLAHLYPVSGSAYAYASRTMDSRVGFMVGWATMLDYFFLPMVVWLIGTAYLEDEFPSVPGAAFLIGFIVLTTALNIVGISLASNVNLILIAYQMLVLVIFVGLSLYRILSGARGHGMTMEPFWNDTSTVAAVSAGAAMTAYSFIGFDAVSTFAEETKDPRTTVPRAIVLTAALAGVIFVAVAYVVQLVHPGGSFANPDSAAEDIAREISGDFFAALFLATVIIAQLTAGIPIQAAGARLMYAMGRDGALPKRLFGYLHPTRHTPVYNILLTGAVGFVALALSVSSSTSFINFGAFTAFAFVNISVIAQYVRDRGTTPRPVLGWVVAPLIGLGVVIWLMTHLSSDALTLGGIWAVIGFAWLTYLTKGFRVPPPHIEFEE